MPFGARAADRRIPAAVRAAWEDEADYRGGRSRSGSAATATRAAPGGTAGDAWHPLRRALPWLREAADRLRAVADEEPRPVPALAPRVALRLTDEPVTGPERLAGEGTLDQVVDDLEVRLPRRRHRGVDPFNGDPEETRRPRGLARAGGRRAGA